MSNASLDGISVGFPGAPAQVQTGTTSPEGITISRFAGDRYVDASGNIYVNPTANVNTGWQLEQTSPA